MESEESGEELEMERSVANRENETSSRNNQNGNNSSKSMSNDNNDEDEKDDDDNITTGGTANDNNNGNPRIIFEQSIPLSQFLLLHLLMNRAPSAEEEKQKLRRSLNYLKNLDKTSEEIVLDEQAIQSLIDIYDLTRKNNDYIPIVIEFKIQLLLKELFEYIYKCLKEYVEKNEIDIELENTNPKFTTFHLICDFAEILMASSKEFAALFHMVGGSKCFLTYFSDRRLIAYLSKSLTRSDEYKNRRKMNYNKALSAMLNALFYLKNNRTQAFKELNAIEIITQFCNELTLDNCELILRAHFILAMLASRAQIERLGNIDFTILILEKTVQMFAEASQKNTKYSSYQFELFYDNDVRSFEISVLNSPKEFIITIMSVIEAFVVNDEIKYRIYATIRNSLYILFTQGDAIEKYFSLGLLIDFAFDDVLNEKLSQLTHLTATIDQILMQASQIDELIVSHVSCFKSLLNIRQIVKDYKVTNSVSMPTLPRSFSSMSGQRARLESAFNSPREEEQSNVIAISYSDVNELSAMKLRYALENLDFDARLVVNKSLSTQKYDVNLAIKSIKECGLLIMCLSSSYEGDKLCQFEAELAMRLGKPYVTVNVQSRYAPDYWLETVVEKHKVLQFGLATARGDIEAVADEIESTLEAHRQARERLRLSRMNGVRTSRLSNREQMPTPRESNETIDQEPFQPPQQQPPPPPPISRHSSAQSRPRRPTNDHNATPPRSAAKPRATPPSNSSVCAIL